MLTLWLSTLSKKFKQISPGQNTVEMAVVVPFVLILLIALFEMGQVFFAYIALVNATRDGTIYATQNPDLATLCPNPIPQVGSAGFLAMDQKCKNFAERLTADPIAATLDSRSMTIARPSLAANPITGGQVVNVTIRYKLQTFTTSMSMPIFDRMGLPNEYTLSYSLQMEVHGQ
jgi:hypothetical protein